MDICCFYESIDGNTNNNYSFIASFLTRHHSEAYKEKPLAR
jgi:hypothetical protein